MGVNGEKEKYRGIWLGYFCILDAFVVYDRIHVW